MARKRDGDEKPRGTDWSRLRRKSEDFRRSLGPAKLPPIIRNRIIHHEFNGPENYLEVFEDNEERTNEAVLTRKNLKTLSARVPKGATIQEILRLLLH